MTPTTCARRRRSRRRRRRPRSRWTTTSPRPRRQPSRAGAGGPAAHLSHAARGALRGGAGRIAHAGLRCAARAGGSVGANCGRAAGAAAAVRSRHAAAAGICPGHDGRAIATSAVVPAVTSDGAVLAGLTASLEAIEASLRRPAAARAAAARARGPRPGPRRGDARPLGHRRRRRVARRSAAVARRRRSGRGCRSVAEAFAPEFRLGGGAAVLSVPAGAAPGVRRRAPADDRGRRGAGRGARAGRGSRRRQPHHLTLGPRVDTATRTVEIAQSAVRMPAQAFARFFDHGWGAHPAGATGAVLLAAAARIAEAHGGALELIHGSTAAAAASS